MSPQRRPTSSRARGKRPTPVQHPSSDGAANNAASSSQGVSVGVGREAAVPAAETSGNEAQGEEAELSASSASLGELGNADVEMEEEEKTSEGGEMEVDCGAPATLTNASPTPPRVGSNEASSESADPDSEASAASPSDTQPAREGASPPAPVQLAVRRGEGGRRRNAAAAADARIAEASLEDLRQVTLPKKKKKPVVTDEDILSAEPAFVVTEVAMISDRKEQDGVVWYFVKWAEVEDESERFEWVTREDCAGASHWLLLVDEWFKEKAASAEAGEEPLPFSTFIASHRVFLTLGASSDFSCVYQAVRKACALLQSEYKLTKKETSIFELKTGVSRMETEGLTRLHVNKLFNFMTKRGWQVQVSGNLYLGQFNGACGIAYAISSPGIYVVATCSRAREGHCFVVEVTSRMRYYLHEGGARLPLGSYNHAHHILWVRHVVPTNEVPAAESDVSKEEGPVKMRPMKEFGKKAGSKKARRPLKWKTPVVQVVTVTNVPDQVDPAPDTVDLVMDDDDDNADAA